MKKTEDRAVYDEDLDQWRLASLASTGAVTTFKRPISAIPTARRAITQYAKLKSNIDRNPRYKAENVLMVDGNTNTVVLRPVRLSSTCLKEQL